MVKKKITVETLAGMSQRQFLQLDSRLGKVENAVQEVKNEVKELKDETKAGFEMLNKTLKDGFRLLVGEIAELKEGAKDDRPKLQDHELRIKHLELKTGGRR